jgi:hypothetical protein
MLASPEAAGRTAIVGKKLVVIRGRKKLSLSLAGTCQGGSKLEGRLRPRASSTQAGTVLC